MSVMDKLATRLGTHSDVPNQELARELASSGDAAAIAEIAAGLENRDKAIQSDCIKVLYETGYIRPELISGYAEVFLRLLASKNNRLVWGAMIALFTVAKLAGDVILEKLDLVYRAMEHGSVITVDNGVRVLAALAEQCPGESGDVMEYLLHHLRTCRASEVPQHAESALPAVHRGNREAFISVLKSREGDQTPAKLARIKKIYKKLDRMK